MLKNWLKIFLYNSLKNKLFFLLTVFGLATGMTGVILALSYWQDESAYNQTNPNKDIITEVIVELLDEKWPYQVAPLAHYAKEKTDKIADYMYYKGWNSNFPAIYQGKNIFLKGVNNVQSNFFDFFPFEIIKGSATSFKTNPDAIAIEEKEVFDIFGEEDPIGKSFQTQDGGHFTVTTVYKNDKASSFKANFLINDIENDIKNGIKNNNWGDFNYNLLIKLKQPNDKESVTQALKDTFYDYRVKKLAKESGITEEELTKNLGNFNIHLITLSDARLNDSNLPTGLPAGKGNLTLLYINIGLSLLILIISIFNYINLSTAYAIKRAKEIGLRKVIGASKFQIVLQQITETIITTCIALVISLALVEILLPSYNVLLSKKLEINFIEYIPHFIFLTFVVILFAGLLPAVYVANFNILKVLKGNFSRSKSGIWLKNTMIIFQFSIATFFIISGVIITDQVKYVSSKDLGFNANQIVSVGWDKNYPAKYKEYLRIKQDLLKNPGVIDVNTGTFSIGTGASSSSSYKLLDKTVQAQNISLDFDYIDLLGMKIIEGRDLNPKLASDSTGAALINKTALQAFGDKDIVGKEIEVYDKKVTVIGIVDDFHLLGFNNKIPPMVFTHILFTNWTQNNISTISVKIKAENAEETISQIETYWKNSVDNTRPFNFEFVDKMFARTYQGYINQRNLFAILNIVVISIALLGLFALASYSIERRYKEIAIKKVLGIETKKLISNLTSQYFILLLIGYVLAILPSYYLMNMWLSNFAYRIDIPITAFLLAFVLMLLLTSLVVVYKAYSATRINPLHYLKYE